MEDKVAKLLLVNEFTRPWGIANTIRELGRSIVEINGPFIASKIPLIANIFNVYSTERESSLKVRGDLI